MGSSFVGFGWMFWSAAAAISACFLAFFFRAKKMIRKITTAITATPPIAPPTMGPIGTVEGEGDGVCVAVVFVELLVAFARVYVGV